MLASIFTPSHNIAFLEEAYHSLRNQTDPNWEMIALLNGKAKDAEWKIEDNRVKIIRSDDQTGFVGKLKALACAEAKGDIMVELDHDDLLLPTALEKVKRAFVESGRDFVYSNSIYCNKEFKAIGRFDKSYGWKWKRHELEGNVVDEVISFDASPASLSKIWFAPDHVRSFTRALYEKVGGYAQDMRVLDDQDLMCRMYQETSFHHINEPLYVYRVHGDNSWLKHNQEINNNVMALHDKYAEKLVIAEMKRKGKLLIELGGRMNAKEGFKTVDLKDADIVYNLNYGIPLPDNSVGVIRAMDVFEHLHDPIQIMKECYRVLCPGGWIICQVPSTDGRGAFQDPTHRSFWNENSFFYYTDSRWAKYIDTPVRFQAARLFTTEKDKHQVCWVKAHLVSLKDGFVPPGQILL